MTHLRSLQEAKLETDAFVTIGVFDGVHLGHQSLIARLTNAAQAAGCKSVAVTFFPHPDKALRDVAQRYYLTTPRQRAELILRLGVDMVITLPFDASLRRLPAADFVERLVAHLRLRELWVGRDFALGFRREGDVPFLEQQGARQGFAVKAIELVSLNSGGRVGSSLARRALERGAVTEANAMLGREYALAGKVALGEQRGRTIGVPTANLAAWSEQILPGNGVYAAWARLGQRRYMAATNIGYKPTFAGEEITVEAHLLDFAGDIYGEEMELRFVKRLRGERKFDSLEALIEQIHRDIDATRALLSGSPAS